MSFPRIQAVTLNVKDANDAPMSVELSDNTVSEDASAGTVVGKLATRDEDRGDSHTYSLVDAKGNEVKDANFEIRENAIFVRDGHSLNYESSTSQTLYVKSTDSAGASHIQAVTLNVKDANDAPVSIELSDNAVSEDASAGTVVGKLSTLDEDRGDSHTYSLVDAKGNEVKDTNFEIRDNAIVVRDGHSLNYESSPSQTLYVKSTDSAGASHIQAVTLNVKDANDTPVSVELSDNAVSENASAGTVVGKLATRDEDRGDSHTYTLVDAKGNDVKDTNFEIRENAIVVRDGHSLNYESSASQTLYVKSTDSVGASYTESVTLTVKDANDAPVSVALSGNAVSENTSAGTVVGKLSTGDEDRSDSHTYALVDAQGNEVKDANFEIRENAIVVRDGNSLNYESSTSQTLYVKSTDSAGASHIQAVTLNVKDANDTPVSVELSDNAVSENASAGTVVGKLSTRDEDRGDSHTYSFVDAKGNEVKDTNFEIRENAVVVRDGNSLNYESSTSQTLYVKSTDTAGASHIQAVTLNVKDANDAPVSVALSDNAVSENATAGTVVGKFSTTDEDRGDLHTYTLVDARGNEIKDANVEICDNAIVVREGHSLNYEASTSQTLYVKATDNAGAAYIQTFTLAVKDVNDAPISVDLTDNAVSEDAAAGTVVGKLSTRDEDRGDSHTYTFVDAKGNEVKDVNFEILDNAIVVRDGHSLNYESSTSQTLYVKSTDSAGASYIEAVTLNVKDANDAPVSVALSGNAVSENATAGTVVGKLSTRDEDRIDSHTYTFVDAKGNEVKDVNFEILDNAIVVRDGHSLNYESSTSRVTSKCCVQ